MSSCGASKFRDTLDLDVHALADLNKRGVPKTDDSPKYAYKADGKDDVTAKYSKCSYNYRLVQIVVCSLVFVSN